MWRFVKDKQEVSVMYVFLYTFKIQLFNITLSKYDKNTKLMLQNIVQILRTLY